MESSLSRMGSCRAVAHYSFLAHCCMLELVVVIIIIAWCLKTLCVVSSSHFRSLCCVFSPKRYVVLCGGIMKECFTWKRSRKRPHETFFSVFVLLVPSYLMLCMLTYMHSIFFYITWRHFWHNLLSVPFFFGLLGSFLLFLKGSFFSQVIHFALSRNWLDIQSGTLFFLPLPFSQSIVSCVWKAENSKGF